MNAALRLDPLQVYASSDVAERVAPMIPAEAARRVDGRHSPGAIRGGAVGAVGAAIGAITGVIGGRRRPAADVSGFEAQALVATTLEEGFSVEGDVAEARTTGNTCVLEFAPDDPRAFRAILLLPLLTSLPQHPEQLYRGRRVKVSGRIARFQGRPEMLLQAPGYIEVVDVSGPPPAATVAPPPTPAEEAPSPPRGLAKDVQQRLAQVGGCERARARWREAGTTARERATTLSRCIEGTGYRCHSESAALAPALSELEWAEQQVEASCN